MRDLAGALDVRRARLERITCCCWSWSSAASSIVTMRSSSGMNGDSTFSSVVLPVPVPPEMRMFSFPCTQAPRNCADLAASASRS